MNYDGYFLDALARLRDEQRYRVFADLERIAGAIPTRSGTRLRARAVS
jgi:5-aminolevulinate synthase